MQCEILGLKTEYARAGSGKPVLILHGWGCDINAIAPVANCVAALGYEAVSLDFPGFGKTEEPKEPWGVPEYAAFTREFIKKQGLEGCSVACHSFGGRVTIMLASAEPELFDKLIMIDAAGVRPKRTLKYYIKTYSYKLGKRLAKLKLVDRVFNLSERQKNAGSADYRALKSDVMRKTFVNVVGLDLTELLPKIKNETLLIWGDKDDATPLAYARIMEEKMPDAGLAVLKGAGHFSYADKYPQFCAVMKAYLAR